MHKAFIIMCKKRIIVKEVLHAVNIPVYINIDKEQVYVPIKNFV